MSHVLVEVARNLKSAAGEKVSMTKCVPFSLFMSGLIRNEHEFKEMLNNVLSGSGRS